MIVVLMGPPGAGKGTQAVNLAKHFNIPHLSTGDIFRTAIANKTPLGIEVEETLNSGGYVSDSMTNNIVKARIAEPDCAKGYILDGYPRTVNQAEFLDATLSANNQKIDHIILIDIPEDVLVERKAGRLFAEKSKKIYHIKYNPPKVAGKCDESGEDLIQREDDKPEVTRKRLAIYNQQTAPVLDYYKGKISSAPTAVMPVPDRSRAQAPAGTHAKKSCEASPAPNRLETINGTGEIEEIFTNLTKLIDRT